MSRMPGLIYIAVMIALSFVFQYQSKLLSGELGTVLTRSPTLMGKLEATLQGDVLVRLLFVLALAAALFVVWLLALSKLDLSVALPLVAISLVINSVGTGMLLGEELGALRIGGVVVVAAGALMVLKS